MGLSEILDKVEFELWTYCLSYRSVSKDLRAIQDELSNNENSHYELLEIKGLNQVTDHAKCIINQLQSCCKYFAAIVIDSDLSLVGLKINDWLTFDSDFNRRNSISEFQVHKPIEIEVSFRSKEHPKSEILLKLSNQ